MADVFISYAREDRDQIEILASALENAGLNVWWDRNISGGAEFATMIENELNAAHHAIVAWSEASRGSHWVRDEAELAREQGKLIPLSLDGSSPPLGFRQLHALDFMGWAGDITASIFTDLLESIGPPQETTKPDPDVKHKFKKPGIAVLPFDNMSSDEELAYVADGLTEDIISSLSTIHHLSIPARNSTFVYKGQAVNIREVADTLDVRYIIEGSIRKLGSRIRITAQFIEAESGNHIWANKFDVELNEFYDSPDEVVEKICGSVFAMLVWAEADRSENLPKDELGAWEYCQRSSAIIGKGIGAMSTMRKASTELDMALSIDPDYALAHVCKAWCLIAAYINGMYEDDEEDGLIPDYLKHLQRARELADGDLLVTIYIGACENFAGQQDIAVQTLEAVLKRNPAMAFGWYIICQNYAYLGRFDDGRRAISRAEEIAPEGGFAPAHLWYRGLLEYLAGNVDEAFPLVERAVLQQPDYGYLNTVAAILACEVGKDSLARKYIAQAKRHNPQLSPRKLQAMITAQPDKQKGEREFELLVELWG